MKEKDLIALGFKRTDVTAEESGYKTDWYYYTRVLGNDNAFLTSSYNIEVEKDEWYVEVFDDETIRFTDVTDMITFIDLIERNTIKL